MGSRRFAMSLTQMELCAHLLQLLGQLYKVVLAVNRR